MIYKQELNSNGSLLNHDFRQVYGVTRAPSTRGAGRAVRYMPAAKAAGDAAAITYTFNKKLISL